MIRVGDPVLRWPITLFGVVLGLFAAAWAGVAIRTPGQPLTVAAEAFPGLGGGVDVGCVTLDHGLTVFGGEGFGGYSAVSLSGTTVSLLSDRGHIAQLEAAIGTSGAIEMVRGVSTVPLLSHSGAPLTKGGGDAEAFIETPGGWAVAFERDHRLQEFRRGKLGWSPTGAALPLSHPRLRQNRGTEAVVRVADGGMVAFAEHVEPGAGALVRHWNAWPLQPNDGQTASPPVPRAASYTLPEGFAVTDAAILPTTDDIIVLERAFSRIKGPRARLSRIDKQELETALRTGGTVSGRPLARFSALHGIDNMEGIAVRPLAGGRLRIYLVSDDNFNAVQRTVLISATMPAECGARPD